MSDINIYETPEAWLRSPQMAHGNIFLTGRAGTGKTSLLKKLIARLRDRAVILAPTGIAAMHVGGQTVHSFFKFPPRLITPADIKRLPNGRVIRAMEVLIIDEVSMLRADMLHAIDLSLKRNRDSQRPFGGVRVILSGDLSQLPPVVRAEEQAELFDRYGGAYFFHAPAFQAAEFSLLALKHVFRQAEAQFLSLLGALRRNRLTEPDYALLQSLVCDQSAIEASETHSVLTPNNANANRINQARLDQLDSRARTYRASVQGKFEPQTYPTEAELDLKVGARVMLLRNDPEGRWVNGSIGQVEGFRKESVLVSLEGEVHEVSPVNWEKYEFVKDPKAKKISRKLIGVFQQIPLRLAYALTIHKAQGLTLDKVYIDFDYGMFAHGQAYVAFSRARTLDGLRLSRPLRQRDLVLDRNAYAFGALEKLEETEDYLLAKFAKPEGVLV